MAQSLALQRGNLTQGRPVLHSTSKLFLVAGQTMSKRIARPRRPSNVLPLETRVSVINDYLTLTKNARRLSQLYGCGRTQIQNIIKARKELLALYEASKQEQSTDINLIPESVPDTLAVVLAEWYQRSQAYNVDITEPLLENVAGHIAPLLGVQSCRPQIGWVQSIMAKCDFSFNQLSEKAQAQSMKSLKYTDIMDELGIQYTIPSDLEVHNNPVSFVLTPILACPEMSLDCLDGPQDVMTQETGEIDSSRLDGKDNEGEKKSDSRVEKDEATVTPKEVKCYREALNILGPLERFALLKGNVRAVGLINQLETLFRDELEKILQSGVID